MGDIKRYLKNKKSQPGKDLGRQGKCLCEGLQTGKPSSPVKRMGCLGQSGFGTGMRGEWPEMRLGTEQQQDQVGHVEVTIKSVDFEAITLRI